MSNFAGESGEPKIDMRLYLEEWGAGQVLPTPIPQALSVMPGRSPWLMLPWEHPLLHARNAVQCATNPASAV